MFSSRFIFIVPAAVCLALAACGGSSPAPVQDLPPAAQRITGNERLGWDQQASDSTALASIRYALYVDGARAELAAATCATDAPSGSFACSGPLPALSTGTHRLELAAYIVSEGTLLESARASPITVIVATPVVSQTLPVWQPGETITTGDGVRLRLELVAGGLDAPRDIAFAPDGRMFVAEQTGRVRVVRDGRLLPDPALVEEVANTASGGGLLAIAFDPGFDRTHFVYALSTTSSASGGDMFRLARFREANDTLADRVVLLDEVDAPAAHAAAALRFGADGKLYATFDDGGNPVVAGDLGSFNGKILRMNADGSTPDDQAGATPVFSYEYRSPRGLDWNPTTGMLWIADGGGEGAGRLSAVAAADGPRKRGVIRATYTLPAAVDVSALAFYRSNLVPAFRDNLLIASDEGRRILRIRFDAQDETRVARIEHLLQDRVGGVRAVACGPDGAIYFGTAHEVGRLVLEETRTVTPRTGAR